jgi:hypothetical protein
VSSKSVPSPTQNELKLNVLPIVAETSSGCSHVSSVNRSKMDDLPVPESPIRRSWQEKQVISNRKESC